MWVWSRVQHSECLPCLVGSAHGHCSTRDPEPHAAETPAQGGGPGMWYNDTQLTRLCRSLTLVPGAAHNLQLLNKCANYRTYYKLKNLRTT
eukprot:6199307-Pleurochrysis_carterae.AAC.1